MPGKVRSQFCEMDDSEGSESSNNTPAVRKKAAKRSQAQEGDDNEISEDERLKDFVKKGLAYLWFTLSDNTPIKRCEFAKNILADHKGLSTCNKVIARIQDNLMDIFGVTLLAYNDITHEVSADLTIRFPSLIMASTLKTSYLMNHYVYIDRSFLGQNIRDYERENCVRALLFMYLGMMFLKGLDAGLDEQSLWEVVESMQFVPVLDVKQSDFRKFLRKEFVTTLYLTSRETKDAQGSETNMHYYWGPRSHVEFNKWDLFTRTLMMMPGKKAFDFPAQMQYILNSSDKQRALEEINNPKRRQQIKAFVRPTSQSQQANLPDTSANQSLFDSADFE